MERTPVARKKFLVADLLCGAGGSSTGCQRALADLGIEMELVCVNHWGVAIETHKRNHPEARHYCEDIAAVRPHLIVPEGRLDLLMASPSCTHHSVARGGKPTSDQQRSDPWHIITWLTELDVERIIIENVWEFTSWGPVDPKTMRPVKARKGEYFQQWIATLQGLGYVVEWRKLNAADFGDATTRQRFILMGRKSRAGKKPVPISWPMPTHQKRSDGKLELFPGVKPWRPAREIIDWGIRGKSIFDRKKPLAPKTLARIHAGAVKFGWPEPFLVILRNHMAAQGIDAPLPTIAANGQHIGLTQPVILSQHNSGAPRSADDPLPTITTGGAASEERQGCARPMLVEPVMTGDWNCQQCGEENSATWFPSCEWCGHEHGDAAPFIATVAHGNDARERDPNSRRANSVDDPLGTVHGDGVAYAVVEPFILNRHGENGSTRAHSIDEPAPTSDCRGAGYIVEPFVMSRHAEGAPRSAEEPIPTQTTVHSPVLVTAYYGANTSCKPVEEPLDTITTQDRFGVVVPVTHSQGGNGTRSVDEPIPTVTTAKGGEFAVVVPVTHAGGEDRAINPSETPLPTVTGANRGELAFIAAQFGEREGQAPRVHDIEQPAPTIAATGHVNLVEGVESGPREYDILFRMLEPHELAAAMGFTTEEFRYEFAGTKTDQVKQIGNAVSVAKMKACVGAICADAVPKRRSAKAIQEKRGAA
ncbi:MAG: DNA cytosine methyltransferase [Parvibaculum sp.]|nr:DNA cytosine methyltransferase [Parvibaculum sp.]